jgi:hypothetical protein
MNRRIESSKALTFGSLDSARFDLTHAIVEECLEDVIGAASAEYGGPQALDIVTISVCLRMNETREGGDDE